MKFHRTNMKTEGGVCKSLKSGPERKKNTSFWAKIGPKKQKFEIPFQRSHADSAKEHSYEVSLL